MSDRELLELAAKAAGYHELAGWSIETKKGMRWVDEDGDFLRYWNPLEDDGDAFRLAVELDMSVDVDVYEKSSYAYAGHAPRKWAMEMWGEDKKSATRRAIVRAAAEIGKGMQ